MLLDSMGKEMSVWRGSYRITATEDCPLRAINLKIISKRALPILGYTRHEQFRGLMGDRKRRKYTLRSFQPLKSTTRHTPLD